jgi:hypothetical protein
MFIGIHNVFALDVNFLDINWKPKHVTIELFEEIKIGGQTSLKNLQSFFKSSTNLFYPII